MIDLNIISLDIEFEQPSEEIIQVGVIVGNLKTGEILEEYCKHRNIGKPISEFIKNLTGIKQQDIDNGASIYTIYEDLKVLHKKYNCFRNCLTWGGGDSEALRNNLRLDDEMFLFGRRWIDVKTVFISLMFSLGESHRSGLSKSMARLGLQFKGRKHNAKDDALNTFLIYRELLQIISGEKILDNNRCRGTHDGKHRLIQKVGSKTGYICSCCNKEV